MGKITLEMLAKSPSHTKKRRDETVQQYVRRLTHLYFYEKNIDEIVSRTVKFHRFCSIRLARSVISSVYISCRFQFISVIRILHIHTRSYLILCISMAELACKLLNELTTQQRGRSKSFISIL